MPRSYPTGLAGEERLPDGALVTVRPIAASDLRRELEFVVGLSPVTRYQRLLSGRQLLPGELKRLTDIDYRCELALVALADDDGEPSIVGVARYVRDDGVAAPGCDFAIVVADAWQGRGLGERLLRRLLHAALADGIRVLAGITLSSNTGMLALGRKLGFKAVRQRGDATITELRWEAVAVGSELDREAALDPVRSASLAQLEAGLGLAAPLANVVAAPRIEAEAPCDCRSGRGDPAPLARA
jgi:acetyltransferase